MGHVPGVPRVGLRSPSWTYQPENARQLETIRNEVGPSRKLAWAKKLFVLIVSKKNLFLLL